MSESTSVESTASHASIIAAEFVEAARVADVFASDPSNSEQVASLATTIASRIRSGGKVLSIGNGGSCADAIHFCEELTGRYRENRPSIPAIACADPGHITCTGNDYGFDQIFSRWVEGLGAEHDVLVAMSTSGNSSNIIRAVEAAKAKGMLVATLIGKGGGTMLGMGDVEFVVPGETSDRIQEIHMLILHAMVGGIERALGY